MEKISLQEVAEAVNGTVRFEFSDVTIDHVCTDSRKVKGNSLFIALKGCRFDGHEYIGSFLENGGIAAISERDIAAHNIILVEDTRRALGDLARFYRDKFNMPIIGITGSVGKTSTNGMIGNVLAEMGEICKTQGNLNNDIGVPLTIFHLRRDQKYAIIEMGMNHFGEISYLSSIARPNIAVITNIGTAHIGNLGTKEGILKAKLEILDGLSPDGVVVLNGDDEFLYSVKGKLPFKTLYYGIHNHDCDIVARDIELLAWESRFIIKTSNETLEMIVKTPGEHHVYNALAAIAVGMECGVPIPNIQRGIQNFRTNDMRQNMISVNGVNIIEDCYNASPDSMKAALDVLALSDARGRKIAVLGNMLELGEYTNAAHQAVGEYVAEKKVDILITVGEHAKLIADSAKQRGVQTFYFDHNQSAVTFLKETLSENDTVLVKASRGARFEEIIQGMQNGDL